MNIFYTTKNKGEERRMRVCGGELKLSDVAPVFLYASREE